MILENNCVPVDSYDLHLQICVADSDTFGIDVRLITLWYFVSIVPYVLQDLCDSICKAIEF